MLRKLGEVVQALGRQVHQGDEVVLGVKRGFSNMVGGDFNKPVGFWTSSEIMTPSGHRSSHWLESTGGDMPKWGKKAFTYEVDENAKVLQLSELKDFDELHKQFPAGDRDIDWEKVGQEYDAVHFTNNAVTHRKQQTPGGITVEALDTESVAWSNPDVLKPKGVFDINFQTQRPGVGEFIRQGRVTYGETADKISTQVTPKLDSDNFVRFYRAEGEHIEELAEMSEDLRGRYFTTDLTSVQNYAREAAPGARKIYYLDVHKSDIARHDLKVGYETVMPRELAEQKQLFSNKSIKNGIPLTAEEMGISVDRTKASVMPADIKSPSQAAIQVERRKKPKAPDLSFLEDDAFGISFGPQRESTARQVAAQITPDKTIGSTHSSARRGLARRSGGF